MDAGALTGAALTMAALPAHAQSGWKSYIVKELGFSFMAPGEVKTEIGTFRGAVSGPRQTMVFRSVANNIEYEVTVMSFMQARAEGATILGERTFMFQENKNTLVDTFARVEPGKDAVYGRKMVVAGPSGLRDEREFDDEDSLQAYQVTLATRLTDAGWFLWGFDRDRRLAADRRTLPRDSKDRRRHGAA